MEHESYCIIEDKKKSCIYSSDDHHIENTISSSKTQEEEIPTKSFSSTEILWTLSFKSATEITIQVKVRKDNNQRSSDT